MGITASEVQAFADRYTNRIVKEQTNLKAPWYAKQLRKVDMPGMAGVINIKAGGLQSTWYQADGGALPAGDSKTPVQLSYYAKNIVTRGNFPRVGLATANGTGNSVNMLLEQFNTAAADFARVRERGYIKRSLGSPAGATTANVSTSFTTIDPSGFRVGSKVDVRTSAGAFRESVVITDVAFSATLGGTATVSFTGSGTGGACATSWATSDVLWLSGAYDYGTVSLADICANASLYGQAVSSQDWRGNLDDTTGDLTVSRLRAIKAITTARGGDLPSHVLSNSVNLTRYGNTMLAGRMYLGGEVMDAGVPGKVGFDGLEWIISENCPNADVFVPKMDDISIHCTIMERVERDGPASAAQGGGNTSQWMLVSQSSLSFDWQMLASEEMRVERRANCGQITNINGPS